MSWEKDLKAKGHPLFLTYQFCCATYIFFITLTFETLLVFNPSFRIDNFYVPNSVDKLSIVNSTTTESNNSILFFDLIIKNKMNFVGIRYHDINLTFSYNTPNKTNSSIPMGTYTVPGFYQGFGMEARRRDVVVTRAAPPSTTEFRVDVATHVKHKNMLWYFKEKRITAGGGVRVDDAGRKLGSKAVSLKSGESDPSGREVFLKLAGYVILLLLGVLFIIFGCLPALAS